MHLLIIQVFLASFALFALTRAVVRFRNHTISLGELGVWAAFWAAVGVCVMAPGITQWFARILGVGRGADAVFYVGLVGLSYAFFRLYLKTRHLEQQITLLVRQLALQEAARTSAEVKEPSPGARRA